MPVHDNNLKTAVQIHDISAETQHVSDSIALGWTGIVDLLAVSIHVTEVTAQAVGTVRFEFQYTTDNGGNWHIGGAVDVPVGWVQAKHIITMPLGPLDIQPEAQTTEASILWRVTSNIASVVANADDFSWQAYLGQRTGERSPRD